MLERREELERLGTSIDRYGTRVRVHDKTIVDVGISLVDKERLIDLGRRVPLNRAQRDSSRVDWEVLVRCENRLSARYRRQISQVKVTVGIGLIMSASISLKE
jgi:hypothetical protein